MLIFPRLSDSDKKYHQGWGGDDGNTELKTEQQATADAVVEGTNEWAADSAGAAEWATPAADASADAAATPVDGEKVDGGRPRREREPEEEDNTLTLDQYLAQQKEKESLALPKLEGPRQANEGANAWKDVVPLEKTGEDEYFSGKVNNFIPSPLAQFLIILLHRPRPLPKPVLRKRRRSSSRSMHVSNVPIVAVVVAVVGVIEVVGVLGDVVDPEEVASLATKSSMLTIKLHSLPYLKILYRLHPFLFKVVKKEFCRMVWALAAKCLRPAVASIPLLHIFLIHPFMTTLPTVRLELTEPGTTAESVYNTLDCWDYHLK